MTELRSGCPINLAVETLGDRWSLVVLRDIMFGGRRTYGDLHAGSLEGIATNILASRLKQLLAAGLLTATPDPKHKQRTIYSLTEPAVQLVPVMVQLGSWGMKFRPSEAALTARSMVLEQGGPTLWQDFMDELRHIHLGAPKPRRSVLEALDAAYRTAAAGG